MSTWCWLVCWVLQEGLEVVACQVLKAPWLHVAATDLGRPLKVCSLTPAMQQAHSAATVYKQQTASPAAGHRQSSFYWQPVSSKTVQGSYLAQLGYLSLRDKLA